MKSILVLPKAQDKPFSIGSPSLHNHIWLTEDGEDLTGARGLEQVAYEHVRGDVGKMHLKPSHRGLLDERLSLRIEG
jgi:hypothetical protein